MTGLGLGGGGGGFFTGSTTSGSGTGGGSMAGSGSGAGRVSATSVAGGAQRVDGLGEIAVGDGLVGAQEDPLVMLVAARRVERRAELVARHRRIAERQRQVVAHGEEQRLVGTLLRRRRRLRQLDMHI